MSEGLEWHELDSNRFKSVYRTSMPGGWLVYIHANANESALAFVPDPEHKWTGGSVCFRTEGD